MFARAGSMSTLLLQIRCKWCELVFNVCRSCWRGQVYCGEDCRICGRREKHRKAQKLYRQTKKGKKAHREAENRRRHGLNKKSEKNMDDAATTVPAAWCIGMLFFFRSRIFGKKQRGCCHFCSACGQIADEFARRGYGSAKLRV